MSHGLGSSSRSLTFQLCAVPMELEVFTVFTRQGCSGFFKSARYGRSWGFSHFPGTKQVRRSRALSSARVPWNRAHGLHELSWRLGVLHGERHWVRLFLLVALADWFGLGVAPLGLPSHPVVQKLSPVLTEHGIVTPVSLWTLLEEFPGLCGLLALSALGNMVHYFVISLVSGSHCRCVWVLPVVFDWISGRCLGRDSWFDSGYMFRVSFERFFDEFHIFSTLRRTRILQYCLRSHAERRSVPSRCSSSRSFSRCSHRNQDIVSMTVHGLQWV